MTSQTQPDDIHSSARVREEGCFVAGLDIPRPAIMGVINVTPDSFSDGGQFDGFQNAIDHALMLEDEGADILDIGGESTRPGSDPVPLDIEMHRVLPVIEGLQGRTDAKLSIDTRKARVMREAADRGVHIINDISALTHDRESLSVAAKSDLAVILMHALGDPKTMQQNPQYDDVVAEIFDYLQNRISACQEAGIQRTRLIADPGIGFGKNLEHNLTLLNRLDHFNNLDIPLVLGVSRKRFIGELGNISDPKQRLPGSLAAALAGIAHGASIVRVHDVGATRQALTVWQAIQAGSKL